MKRSLLWATAIAAAGCAGQLLPPPDRAEPIPEALGTEAPAPAFDATAVEIRRGQARGLAYVEVVFGGVDPDRRLPLVVMLHGRGDVPRVPEGPFYGVELPMRLVLFQAPDPFGEGYTWLPVSVTDRARTDELTASLRSRAAHLAAAIDALRLERPTLGAPIVTGFSQGGMLSFALAVHHPEVVGDAFPLAGWLPPGLMPTDPPGSRRAPPIRSMHGDADAIMPLGPTADVVVELRRLGYDAGLRRFDGVGHHMRDDMDELLHVWLRDAVERRLSLEIGETLATPSPATTHPQQRHREQPRG